MIADKGLSGDLTLSLCEPLAPKGDGNLSRPPLTDTG
jgi:hypothetical protein